MFNHIVIFNCTSRIGDTIVTECIILQIRKVLELIVLELIAFALLIANKQVYSKMYGDIRK